MSNFAYPKEFIFPMRCEDLLRGKKDRADLIDDADEDAVPERVIWGGGGSIESFLLSHLGLVGALLDVDDLRR
jgi:hypothetical protein